MTTPRLSICLPVYNGQRYLAAAVESLLAQTFSDYEIVIVDNASTDDTEAVARELLSRDRRIRYERNARNLGAAPNFNRAYELARGELIRWASHDDLWTPDAMQACIDVLDQTPHAVACHGQTAVIDAEGTPIPTYDAEHESRPSPEHVPIQRLYDRPGRRFDAARPADRLKDLLLGTHWCYEIFAVIRRKALTQTGLHGSFYGSDKVLLAELLMQGPILSIDRTVFLRRDHTGNSTSLRTHTERADWMDTSLQGKIRRPHAQLLKGYWRAIWRSDQPITAKLACSRVVMAWMMQLRKLKNVVRESDSQSQAPQAVSAGS